MATSFERPLRADARRNREKILRAARAVLGSHGREASMEDVARRAKVGVGTLYRHFPTKEALMEAVVRERFITLVGWAKAACERPDASAAFEDFVWRAAELHASDRMVCQMMRSTAIPPPGDLIAEVRAVAERLMERAKAEGGLRRDAQVDDLPMIMSALAGMLELSWLDLDWRRFVALQLDGLRPCAGGRALPGS